MNNFSNVFQEFMKNPEMLKQSLEMLQNNPAMMDQFQSMSKSVQENPDILNSFMEKDTNLKPKFKVNDNIITKNLKNTDFNNLNGVIESYDKESNRYYINIPELNKKISIKEDNLEEHLDKKLNDTIPIEIE